MFETIFIIISVVYVLNQSLLIYCSKIPLDRSLELLYSYLIYQKISILKLIKYLI